MRGRKGGPMHRGEAGGYDAHRHWVAFTPTLPDEERTFPETVPHEYLGEHRLQCRCSPCVRFPEQELLRKLKVRASARLRA